MQSLSRSSCKNCTWRHFYGTENEIWAGSGLVGNTEGADYSIEITSIVETYAPQFIGH